MILELYIGILSKGAWEFSIIPMYGNDVSPYLTINQTNHLFPGCTWNPNEIPVLIGQKTLFLEGLKPLKNRGDIHSPRRFQQVGPTSLHRQATQKGTFTRALCLSKFQVGSCCHALCVLGGTGCASVQKGETGGGFPGGLVGWWVGGGRWWPLNIDFWGKKCGMSIWMADECPIMSCFFFNPDLCPNNCHLWKTEVITCYKNDI